MNKKNTNIVTAILLILTLAGILISYESLPQIIPTHWGINGEVNETGPKSTIWIFYGLMIGVNILFIVIANIDPKKHNYKIFEKSYNIFRIVFNIFFIGIIALIVMAAKGNSIFNTTRSIMFLTGILLTVIGNYLPKFKPNYTTGIKTPWTLASEDVWKKTHRISGPLWVGGGIVISISSLIVSTNLTIIILLIVVAVLTLISTGYSYFAYKKEQDKS
jgi:uncharacterized membrane protein